MARPYRLQGEGYLYHITSRGDGRKKIYANSRDKEKFLEYLRKAKDKFKYYLYAYVLMDNHYHLLLETSQANLSQIMHYINSSYTTYYNIKKNQCGHLFQGRYKSIVVDRESYLLELSRYIHLNPVRANLVKKLGEYRWTSYHEYMGRKGEEIIDKEQVKQYIMLSAEKYSRFAKEGIKKKNPLKEVYGGFILGKTDFIKVTLDDLGEQLEGREVSFRKIFRRNIEIEEIVKKISRRYGIEEELIYKTKKRPMEAKKMAIYLCKRLSAKQNKEIGVAFGLTYSAVSKAAGYIEKKMKNNKKTRAEIELIISHFKG